MMNINIIKTHFLSSNKLCFKIWKNPKKKSLHGNYISRKYSQKSKEKRQEKFLRNIGIMAHIDAGKTTTTERMLYYSGITDTIGEVHDGNTVMDYMDQERERGITITSAAISFPWKNHLFNLIDTPGHVDFTMEVERSLRVIDGAVAVFDSSAGVEAQSLTVWLQADRYNLPRICFLNKMDKESSDLKMCLRELETKLKARPLLIQSPLGRGKAFQGIVDLITMNKMDWSQSKDTQGRDFKSEQLTPDSDLWKESLLKRSSLVEKIADLDNEVAETVLEKESTDLVPPQMLLDAIRRVTLSRSAIPVLIGSAYKNVGVQPLMDSVCRYLPSPLDGAFPGVELYAPSLCAVAFKILHHPRKGVLTFIRVYSGSIEQGKKIYNANQKHYEKVTKIFYPFADDFEEVRMADKGNILVATGLKITVTGDTLLASEKSMQRAQDRLPSQEKERKESQKQLLMGVPVPEPVFMCSIEAPSISQQKALDAALNCLQKEDPSLRVTLEKESGQTVLAGMGELHLSIMQDRIKKEFKVEAELGPLMISYREGLANPCQHSVSISKMIGDSKQEVNMTLSLEPCQGYEMPGIEFKYTKENLENLQSIRRPHLEALKRGLTSSLLAGPLLRFPVIDVKPKLHWLQVGRKTAETFVAAAASQCLQEMLREADVFMLEPVMKIEIVVPEEKCPNMLSDLAKRRAQISSVGQRQDFKIIEALCPLAELVGFSSSIRAASSGLANLSLEFAFHRRMNEEECSAVVSSFSGFSQF